MDKSYFSGSLMEAEQLLVEFEKEPEHPRHVARLASQLFFSLEGWHKRGEEEKHLLHLAALLHDTGWAFSPSGEGHHKHSAKIIQKHTWKNLSLSQVNIVAQVARYHRKALPDEKHESYKKSTPQERRIICELAGILRVADALDRTHRQIVQQVQVDISSDVFVLRIKSLGEYGMERRHVLKKCDLLELAAKRKVRFAV